MPKGIKNLVVFPFKAELLGAVQHLSKNSKPLALAPRETRTSKGVLLFEFGMHKTAWAVCGHGKSQAAMVCEHLVGESPDLQSLVCAGSGGALSSDVGPGDLVVGVKTIEHDFYEKAKGSKTKPSFKVDPTILNKTMEFTSKDFKVFIGNLASGDEDIVESARKRLLFEDTGALAVGWEGSGVARVARWQKLAFCEIRAITDFAEGHVLEDFQTHFPLAMRNLGTFLKFMFLTKTTESE